MFLNACEKLHRCYVWLIFTVSTTSPIRLESTIWVLRYSQYPKLSSVLVNSQIKDDDDDDNDNSIDVTERMWEKHRCYVPSLCQPQVSSAIKSALDHVLCKCCNCSSLCICWSWSCKILRIKFIIFAAILKWICTSSCERSCCPSVSHEQWADICDDWYPPQPYLDCGSLRQSLRLLSWRWHDSYATMHLFLWRTECGTLRRISLHQ